MSSEQQTAVDREYHRIGIRTGERLPMPRGLNGESDYLKFLREVPDGSGAKGFAEAMAQRAKRS
jgi:hypothetical protein